MEERTLPWVDEIAIVKESPTIHHYTSFDRFKAILNSGGIFAKHYAYTNDRTEFKALRQPLIKSMLKGIPIVMEYIKARSIPITISEGEFERVLASDAPGIFDGMIKALPTPAYFSCFSGHKTESHIKNGLLTMWRAYGQRGSSVALGFDTEKVRLATNEIKASRAVDVIYLDQVGYGMEDQIVRRRLNEIDLSRLYASAVITTLEKGPEVEEATSEKLLKIMVLCSGSKHDDFCDEREIRLVVFEAIKGGDNGRSRLRSADVNLLVEYLEALSEVLIGPSAEQDRLYADVRRELDRTGFKQVGVRKSETPFRETILHRTK